MTRSLYIKLLLSYLAFALISAIVLFSFTSAKTTEQMLTSESENLYREATLLAKNYASIYYSDELSMAELQNEMNTMAGYLSAQIQIVDGYGRILLDTQDASISERVDKDGSEAGELIEGFDIGDFGNKYYQIGTFYDQFSSEYLTVFSPITVGYMIKGYVIIHKSELQITRASQKYMDISMMTALIIFASSFIILIVFTVVIYVPLRKIIAAAKLYGKGEFDHQIAVHSNDEVGTLANTLNYMATELGAMEEDQRKFVSNVSHDFRSPLTSIKGYVEAMIDGIIPPEMQDKYLNIILFETERLNKLTQGLLELNKFGEHGMIIDRSDFDINQMIRTTLLTFEGTCEKKGITFDLVLTGESLYVNADASKIQRVLYNLIDNAVKFSHHNSSIKIETSMKYEKVLISVKDSGIGIPADSVKKIWDRFYKTDLSRGKDKKGTGLGLAIVKEIISAHGSNIDVISTEGVGTKFLFTLPEANIEE